MILLINYYIDKRTERQEELERCLQLNLDHPMIDKVVMLHKKEVPLPEHEKIVSVVIYDRPSYSEFFKIGNSYEGVKILANSDIYFNQTLHLAERIKKGEVYALCRWNYQSGILKFYDHRDSQDVWIWRGDLKVKADFPLGVPGCDNKIGFLIHSAGYEVKSPSLSIQAIHLHQSGIRNYSNKDIIDEPYLYLKYHTIDNHINHKPVINYEGIKAKKPKQRHEIR